MAIRNLIYTAPDEVIVTPPVDPDPVDPGDPPVDPGEPVTSIVTNGVTFSFLDAADAPLAVTATYQMDGTVIVLHPGETMKVNASPAPTTAGGLSVQNGYKNPVRNGDTDTVLHPWDARYGTRFSAALAVTYPVTIAAGDSLAHAVHNPTPFTSDGGTASHGVYVLSYGGLVCVASLPANPANSIVPIVKHQADAGARSVWTKDFSAVTFPRIGAVPTSSTVETIEQLTARVLKYNVVASQLRAVEDRRKMTPAGFTAADGYGQSVQAIVEQWSMRLLSSDDADTDTKKRDLARAIFAFGAQHYDAINGNVIKVLEGDGGHQGLLPYFVMFLGWLEDDAKLRTLHTDIGGNELRQNFRVTAGLLTKMREPHSNTTLAFPRITLRKTVTAVSGNTLTFANATTVNEWTPSYTGLTIVRESDNATARISTYSAGSRTITIDAQPSPAFAVNDVIFCRASFDQAEGDAEWTIKGVSGSQATGEDGMWYYTPAVNAAYRNINESAGAVMAAVAMGFIPPELEFWPDYVERAMTANTPTAMDNWPDAYRGFACRDFWASHWATIKTTPYAFA